MASWSGIDYYGRWKALHYFARRFFAPVLVSPIEEKGDGQGNDKGSVHINVWAVSDRRADSPARLTVRVLDFDGHELWRKEHDVVLTANASRVYLSMRKAEVLGSGNADPARVVLVAELSERGQPLSRNLLSLVKTKELALPPPALKLEVAAGRDAGQDAGGAGALAVTISSPTFAVSRARRRWASSRTTSSTCCRARPGPWSFAPTRRAPRRP